MTNILLEIDDDVLDTYERRAAAEGVTTEEMVRRAILASATETIRSADQRSPGSVPDR